MVFPLRVKEGRARETVDMQSWQEPGAVNGGAGKVAKPGTIAALPTNKARTACTGCGGTRLLHAWHCRGSHGAAAGGRRGPLPLRILGRGCRARGCEEPQAASATTKPGVWRPGPQAATACHTAVTVAQPNHSAQ